MSGPGSVLFCFALKEEAASFQKIAADKPGVSILLTGVGSVNAEKSLREFLASDSPELVLTCGFAGGLNPGLNRSDVVFEIPLTSSLSPSNGDRVSGGMGEGFASKLLAAGAAPGKFFCANRIATTAVEKKKLRDETGADAVEMESAAIHAICLERGIPCATVRVISDTANEDLPLDFNQLSKPDMNLDYGKLALAIVKSPGKISALMQLRKRTMAAAENLAAVLARLI